MFKRILTIQAPEAQSFFLWGARQTGKSSFIKSHYPESIYFDLLESDNVIRFLKAPYVLREELEQCTAQQLQHPIVIDEIQKVPELLDEIHSMIENKKYSFILCSSSARKLKTQETNLLGGRAWIYYFYPLVYPEIPHFDLKKALQHGLIPVHYLAQPQHIYQHLQAYINIYLIDEIRHEGLVRQLSNFARFLDVVGLCHGEMINVSNIARDCHIDRSSVQGYFQILVDTLIGYFVYPYHYKIKRDLISAAPKFYLFDVGVANFLARRVVTDLAGDSAGRSFEHYIFMELVAYKNIRQKRFDIHYWRTKTGLEVDFVLANFQSVELAIEVKISMQVHQQDIKGLIAFCEEHPKTKAIVVSLDIKPRRLSVGNQKIDILPWQLFLEKLWDGELV